MEGNRSESKDSADIGGKVRIGRTADPTDSEPMVAAATEPEYADLDLRPLKEAAELYGYHPSTLREWAHRGFLTDYGSPGKRLVDMRELRKFLGFGPSKTTPPSEP